MKRFLTPVLALAMTCFLVSCQETTDSLGIKINLDKRVLSNGMTVILVEDHTVPLVSYQTWYRVGSVDEKPGMTGISHLFEHLMFKGTPKYGPRVLFQKLEARGADVNAYATRDYSVFYESFAPNLLEQVIDIESDRMANLTLDAEGLNGEKMIVFEERRLRAESSPDGKIQEALWQLAYHRHPYQWPVMGYPGDLLILNIDMIKDFFKSYYQPANAALVVVGDMNANATFELIKKYYASLPAQPRPVRDIPVEPEQTEERRLILRDSVASERFVQAYHVTSADNDDSYALDVLANILFEGGTSRAARRLVEEKNIALSVSGSAFTPTYPGLFIVSVTMKGKVPSSQAEAELDQVIQEIQSRPVSEEEISAAVKQLTVQMMDSIRTPHGLGQLIGTVQTVFGDPKRFADDLSKYLKVKVVDVQRVAQKYLNPNNRSIVTLMPTQTATETPTVIPAVLEEKVQKSNPKSKVKRKKSRKSKSKGAKDEGAKDEE